jgi:O-antigen/teichoic acid export membrane protein
VTVETTTEPAAAAAPTPPRGSRLIRGMAWMAALRWTAQVVSWSATVIVARLLTPGDYGLAGMALLYGTLAAMAIDCGLPTVIISYGTLRDDVTRQINTTALLLGSAGALLTVVAAPVAAAFFEQPQLVPLLRLVAISLLCDSARVIPVAVLSKALRYREVATIDMIKSVVGSSTVLISALAGLREWSLALGLCAGSLFATAFTLTRFRTGITRPSRADLRDPFLFGIQNWVARFAWYAYSNAGFWIVGRMIGPAALGQYSLAWTMASLPGDKLVNVITGAADPFFASIRSDQAGLRLYLLRLTEAISLVVLLPLMGLLLVADLAVPIVLGAQWGDAVTPLRLLVLYHAVSAPLVLIGSLNVITGGVRFGMILTTLIALSLVAAQVAGARWFGVAGVAGAWPLVYPTLALFTLIRVLGVLGVPMGIYAAAWRPAAKATIAMAAAVVAVRLLANWLGASALVELIMAIGMGAAAGIVTALRSKSLVVDQLRIRVNDRIAAWRRRAPAAQ